MSSQVRRVLIVSPHFPPANGADAQRARMTVPHLREFGWETEVLSVASNCLSVPHDPWLSEGVPESVLVHRAHGLSTAWSWIPGLGTLDLRARFALRRKGEQILASKKVDLVYFSTTVCGVFPLGVLWRRRFGVPFVLDYQDPWVNDYYRIHPQVTPPGGRLKYSVVDRIARWQEPRVLADCAGITAVSRAFPEQLRKRYPALPHFPVLIAPFPGSERDFERARDSAVRQDCFDPHDGNLHWVYVGRGGDDMTTAVAALFNALSRWRRDNPQDIANLQLHFIGTSYAPAGRGKETIKPIAARFGLDHCVQERTDRIRYSTMLKCIADAHALIVPGSDDPSYNASKLFPYLLARKPMLTIFHECSPVVQIVQELGGARLVTFSSACTIESIAQRITDAWLRSRHYATVAAMDKERFGPYTARGQAEALSDFFSRICNQTESQPNRSGAGALTNASTIFQLSN